MIIITNLVKINEHGQIFITPYETIDAAQAAIETATQNEPLNILQNEPGCMIIRPVNSGTTYIITNSDYTALTVKIPNGKLMLNTVLDPLYPGLDIEYIADNEDENTDVLTRPRVLIEKPRDTKTLAAMIWGDRNSEDYTYKTTFDE